MLAKLLSLKVVVAIIGVMFAALVASGMLLKLAVAKNDIISAKLDSTEAELDAANKKLDGWIASYNALSEEHKKVNKVTTEVARDRERYRVMVSSLSQQLKREAQRHECAGKAVPDPYYNVLIGGLPSRGKTAPSDVQPGSGAGSSDRPGGIP